MKRILLVNPWIYDFAAYNFGIKPLGLLRIASFLRLQGDEVFFIDCLEGAERSADDYGFSKLKKIQVQKPDPIKNIKRPYFRYGITAEDFSLRASGIKNIDSIFVTSGMTYWYPGVQFTISRLRAAFPGIPIVLGGIYSTLCYSHAVRHAGADIIWKGDFLPNGKDIPDPVYPAFDLLENRSILPVQMTEGCPFRCSYCASKKLKRAFHMKDPVQMFEEIMFYHKTFGTRNFVFYDDALLVNSEKGVKKLLRMIIASGVDFTFHTPNGLHARYIDDELARLFKKANFMDLRLSLETSDEDIQDFTGGKVTNSQLRVAVRNLREAGYSKEDIGIYLLVGAPWMSIDSTIKDVYFVNSLGAKAILASYSPVPGTVDHRSLVHKGTITSGTDPLWHNKTIFSDLLSPEYMDKIQEIRRFTSQLNRS